MFHTTDAVCQGCQKKLKQADPYLVEWFNTKVKPSFSNAHISCAYRNLVDQEQAFAEGKSQLHWPKSPHNRNINGVPCSSALDLFEQIDGKALYRPKFYLMVWDSILSEGLPIKWGGLWKTIGDANHFELELPQGG